MHLRWEAAKRIDQSLPAVVHFASNRPSVAALEAKIDAETPLKDAPVTAAWAWYTFLDSHGARIDQPSSPDNAHPMHFPNAVTTQFRSPRVVNLRTSGCETKLRSGHAKVANAWTLASVHCCGSTARRRV